MRLHLIPNLQNRFLQESVDKKKKIKTKQKRNADISGWLALSQALFPAVS